MHASCIYDDRLFGGAYEIAMGWEMAPGASRAQESQVREKLLGGLGRAKHVGGAVRVFKMWWAQNECLFVCPKLCGGYPLQLWHSQGWRGGRAILLENGG